MPDIIMIVVVKLSKKKIQKWVRFTKGKAELPLLTMVILAGIALAGGLLISYHPGSPPTPITHGGICCDKGDGDQCTPYTDTSHVFTFMANGTQVQYGLLRSNVAFDDCEKHLLDSGQRLPVSMSVSSSGDPIILDTSNVLAAQAGNECGDINHDMLADWRTCHPQPFDYFSSCKKCVPIPNDELIYVCKKNCFVSHTQCAPDPEAGDTFYGDGTTVFDVYFRLNDYPTPGIPDVIKNCTQGAGAWNPGELNQQNVCPSIVPYLTQQAPTPYDEHKSLQLHWFLFNTPSNTCTQQWIRPYCKPAVYLYPQQKESVHVAIAPKGNLLTTTPAYGKDGWQVTADPAGNITYNNQRLDYLYYEAAIPDALLPEQKSGYVIGYNDLPTFFSTQLPKMGLQGKEATQFSQYWMKALPKNPYYLISVVPQSVLNTISPLNISPKPDTVIRVTLYFQPMDKQITIPQPPLPVINRHGFTVVEWGGLFKQDSKHPFTCLM